MKRALCAALLAATILLCLTWAGAENYEAGTMRLLRFDGDVEILDAGGFPRFVLENVRFASGEILRTGEDGRASVSLDDSKIVTLDAQSRVTFVQESSHLLLTLNEGTIFLDVSQKLDENESLDIQTTTMTAGIRGTIVFLTEREEEAGERTTVLAVLEGTAQVTYTDTAGARRMLDVPAGRKLTVPGPAEEGAGVVPALSPLTHEDLGGFVTEQVLADETLVRRVTDGSEQGPDLLVPGAGPAGEAEVQAYPAEGDWAWTGSVTLVAQSASKLYDGKPLSRSSDVLVYGLPETVSIRVAAVGSQTDAGVSPNKIGTYQVFNSAGEDITAHFQDIRCVSGTLVVDPVPVTVWTGSAEKVYDGTPLTCREAGITAESDYVRGEPQWRNTSVLTRTGLGAENLVSACGCTWVHGTNPLTGETRDIPLYTGQRLSIRLQGDAGNEELIFEVENLTPADLPEEVLRLYRQNPDMLQKACQDAGWDPDAVKERIAELPEITDAEQASAAAPETLLGSANVRITLDSGITDYNSRPLTDAEAHFAPVELEPTITVRATGSQTAVGSSLNTYEIDWGGANAQNYTLAEELGTLTVTDSKAAVTLTAASAEKVYDGESLTADEVTVEGLPEGFTVEAMVNGSQTEAGESENLITSYSILNADGLDVTAAFANVSTVSGTLKVTPLSLSIDCGGTERMYTGEPWLPTPTATYRNGAHAGETVAGTSLSGSARRLLASTDAPLLGDEPGPRFRFTLFTGDTVDLTITGVRQDVGTYTLNGSVVSSVGDSLTASFTGTTLTVTANDTPITLTAASAEKVYDGEALTADGVTVTGLPTGFTCTAAASGSQTDAGESANTVASYAILDAEETDVTAFFTGVTTAPGKLTVKPAPLTVTTGSASKVYDGTALTAPATVTGLVSADEGKVTVTATGAQTAVGSASNAYTIDWGTAKAGNYTLSETVGTLTVTANDAPITLTAASAEKVYDGTALTADGVTVTGLPAGFTCAATANGSQTDAGESANTVASYAILDAEEADVTAFFTGITTAAGKLTVKPAPLTVTTGSASKVYDGTALTAPATVTGLVSADEGKVAVTATGAQTAVGSASNAYTIDWGTAKAGNYTLSETVGTLIVTANDTPITLTAASAEKVYDGEALTADGVTATGLPAGFTCTAAASGSQTDAGESANTVASYAILDAEETDVTGFFTGITTAAGKLTVKPAPLTVTTGSASKVYDGTALTAPATVSGLVSADEGKVAVTATGTITDAGSIPNAYTIAWGTVSSGNYKLTEELGTLTVEPIALTIDVLDTAYTFNNAYNFVDVLVTCDASFTSEFLGDAYYTVILPDARLVVDLGDSAKRKGAGATELTPSVSEWSYGNGANYSLTLSGGTLTVLPAPITITTGSASRTYDGTPLTSGEVTVSGFPGSEAINIVANGSLTNAGSTVNTYVINDWNGWDPDNYAITDELGTLTVTRAPLTVTTESADKVYDGTPLTASGAITGLAGSDAAAVTLNTTGAITNAGSAQNTYEIDWGTANPDNYEITGETLGTLTVEKLTLNFSLSDVTMTYTTSLSGVPFPAVSLTYGNGAHMGETIAYTSRQYNGSPETGVVYAEPHFYTLFTGDRVCQYISGMGQDAGEYTIKADCNGVAGDDTNMSNFSASCNTASWIVTPRALSIQTSSASKPYDGTPLTSAGVTVSGLTDLDAGKVTVTATGTITDFGMADNMYSIDWGGVNPGNYTVTQTLGTLEITATDMPITVTSADAEGVYTPFGLSNSGYTVEGLPEGFTLTAEVTGSLSVPGTAPNTIASYTITDSNGADVKAYFTGVTLAQGTLTLAKAKIDIWSVSETFTYDGSWRSSHIYYQGAYAADNPSYQISSSNPAVVRNAGTYEASFTVGDIRSDLQDRYELGDVRFGTITIEPVQLSFAAGNVTAEYSGDVVVPNVTLTFASGSRAGETVSPASTSVTGEEAILTYKLFSTDTVTLTLHGLCRDAGTHSVTGTLAYDSAATAGNYIAAAPSCTVTITPLTLTISTVSETKVYDGYPLPVTTDRPTAVGFLPDDADTVYVDVDSASVTDVGSVTRGYTINWNGVSEGNYAIAEDLGTLTVEPLKLTVDLHGGTYDAGSPYVPADPTMAYANGSHAGASVPGTRNGSAADVTFTLFTGDTIRVTVDPPGEEPGTYTLGTNDTCSGNSTNFVITWLNRTVTIQ